MFKSFRSVLTCLLLLFFCNSYSQTKTISGIVYDENGNTINGANIYVKNTRIAAATKLNGKFTLTIPETTQKVFVQYADSSSEVFVGDKLFFRITLNVAVAKPNFDVAIGYEAISAKQVTSSISSLHEEDINNLPLAGTDQMLQGKLAGVVVSANSGQPGAGISINVRGITTISNIPGVNNQPLYIIDGVPLYAGVLSAPQDKLGGRPGQTMQSILATLNPSDIQSIDVLKDAAAQAIYGAFGANGVILITTKKSNAEGKLNYDTYYGWQMVHDKLPLMNLQEYAEYYNSVLSENVNPALDTISEFKNTSVLGEGANWQDAIFQTGFMQNHALSFSSSTSKSNFFLSGNYYNQQGIVIGSGFKRYAVRANFEQQIKSWLKAGFNGTLSRSNQKIIAADGEQSVISLALTNSPVTPVKSLDGDYISTISAGGVSFGNMQNPVALALLRNVHSIQSRAIASAFADIQIIKGLAFHNRFNIDYLETENTAFQPSVTNQQTNQLIIGPNRLREERNNYLFYALQNYISYNRTFLNRHNINAMLGHEAGLQHYNIKYVTAINTANNIPSIDAGTIDAAQTGGASYTWAMESYFAKLLYNYDEKYFLNISVRRDGASSYGPANRNGYFPAASAAWLITNESFANNSTTINFFKLRFSAGKTGYTISNGSNLYSSNIRLIPSLNGLFGQNFIPGFPANSGNPNLHWQSVTSYNGGFDATFFHKRLDVTVDVSNKKTSGLIIASTLPAFGGFDMNGNSLLPGNEFQNVQPPVVNSGKIKNTGIDVSITSHNISKKNFTWTTGLIFSHYKNKVEALNSKNTALYGYSQTITPQIVTATVAGEGVGQFYGYVTDGLYREQKDLDEAPVLSVNGPSSPNINPQGTWFGDIRYKDLDGNDTLDYRDQTFIGNPNPKFTYSFINNLAYKNFELSIFFYGVYGSNILNYSRMETEADFNVYQNQLKTVNDRYTSSNTNGSQPRYNPWNRNNLAMSDRFIESGSYLRIQHVSLAYNLPAKWINKAKITHGKIYVSAQNIYTFTKYNGYDPEIGAFNNNMLTANIDYGHYPLSRTITVGANIEF